MSKSKSFKIGRKAGDGTFIPVEKARQMGDRATVEHIPKKGYGTESDKPTKK